ncbi:MAG: hypothetical protein IK062_10900 [Selenomonadaceae bacterium]|nr:hypothetical protein [Selenomonadaceae bacterium]
MNLKKTNPEIREYVKSRIIEFKEKGYAVKEIGEFLNINDDYPEKISNLFLQKNLSFIEGCFVAWFLYFYSSK